MSKPDRITDGKEKTAIFDQVSSVHRLQSNPQSLLIGTSGSFRGETSAALAIYFGPDSRHNFSSSIPKGQVKRQEDSDLYAATMALETIQSSDLTTDLKLIVVKVCSSYIPAAISKRCWIMEQLGYSSQPYSAHNLMLGLHEICKQLEADGIEVKFWPVSRKMNRDAKEMSRRIVIEAASADFEPRNLL